MSLLLLFKSSGGTPIVSAAATLYVDTRLTGSKATATISGASRLVADTRFDGFSPTPQTISGAARLFADPRFGVSGIPLVLVTGASRLFAEGGLRGGGASQVPIVANPIQEPLLPMRFGLLRGGSAVVHEFAGHGYRYVDYVSDWEAYEEVNAGYKGASGRLPWSKWLRHRDLFRYGGEWTMRLSDTGAVIWSGELLGSEREGDIENLIGRGYGHMAEKQFERMLFQTKDASLWNVVDFGFDQSMNIQLAQDSRYSNTMPVWTFSKSETDNVDGSGAIQFVTLDGQLSRLAFGIDGGQAGMTLRIIVSVFHFDGRDYEGGFGFGYVPVFETTITTAGYVKTFDIDLAVTSADAAGNQDGVPTFWEKTQNGVLLEISHVATASKWSIGIMNLTVNGIVPYQRVRTSYPATAIFNNTYGPNAATFDWPDRFTTADMVAEVCSRLGWDYKLPKERGGMNAIPADFMDTDYTDVLDYAAMLQGWRWCVFGVGKPEMDFHGFRRRVWTNVHPQAEVKPEPLERYDTVMVPFMYPDGKTQGWVKVRADRKYRLHPHREYGRLSIPPAFTTNRAIDLGRKYTERMSQKAWAGTAQLTEVERRGNKVDARLMHAGDTFVDPYTHTEMRIASVRKQEAFADITGLDHLDIVEKMNARRLRRLRSKGHYQG